MEKQCLHFGLVDAQISLIAVSTILKPAYVTFWATDQIHIEMYIIDFSLKASLRSGRSVLCALFTFGFVHQLQTAENTIFLLMEIIFHSGLDGTMILYTMLDNKSC